MANLEDALRKYLETSEDYDFILKEAYLEDLFEDRLDIPTLKDLLIIGKSRSDIRLVLRTEEEILSEARTYSEYREIYLGMAAIQNPSLDSWFISRIEESLLDSADSFIKILNVYYHTRIGSQFSFLLRTTEKLLDYAATYREKSSVYKAAVLSNDSYLEEKSKRLILGSASFRELGNFASLSKRLGRKNHWEITKERIKRISPISSLFKRLGK